MPSPPESTAGSLAQRLYIFHLILKRVRPSHLYTLFTYCLERNASSYIPKHSWGREDESVREVLNSGSQVWVRLCCAASFLGEPSQREPPSTGSSVKLGLTVHAIRVPQAGQQSDNDKKRREGRRGEGRLIILISRGKVSWNLERKRGLPTNASEDQHGNGEDRTAQADTEVSGHASHAISWFCAEEEELRPREQNRHPTEWEGQERGTGRRSDEVTIWRQGERTSEDSRAWGTRTSTQVQTEPRKQLDSAT